MEKNLSGTLAIDLGNTNTVIAFQDQKNINSVLVEIPNITSSPELFLQQFGLKNLQRFLKLV